MNKTLDALNEMMCFFGRHDWSEWGKPTTTATTRSFNEHEVITFRYRYCKWCEKIEHKYVSHDVVDLMGNKR